MPQCKMFTIVTILHPTKNKEKTEAKMFQKTKIPTSKGRGI